MLFSGSRQHQIKNQTTNSVGPRREGDRVHPLVRRGGQPDQVHETERTLPHHAPLLRPLEQNRPQLRRLGGRRQLLSTPAQTDLGSG